MDTQTIWIAAVIVGAIIELIVLVKAWQDSLLQFLACLLIPLYIYYYVFARLASPRRGLILGGLLVCTLLILILWPSPESLPNLEGR